MKTIKVVVLLICIFCGVENSNSQTFAILKGKKYSVHKIDDKYGNFQGNMGYSYSEGLNGKLDIKIEPGEHTIEFLPWYGDYIEYKLVFTAEEGKVYEIIKQKEDTERPQIVDTKTKKPVENATIKEVMHIPVDKNDKIIHLYDGKIDRSNLAILSLEPEYFDIIPIVYKIDDIWGPVTAGCMRRFNNLKLGGGDLRGAMHAMSFTIELLPGVHTLEYSFHSNKVKFSIKGGLSTGSDSYEVYKLKFNFEIGKSYTFKFLDSNDPTSLTLIEKQ